MKKYITILALFAVAAFGLAGCAILDSAFTSKVAVYDQSGQPVLNADGTQMYIYEESALVKSIIDGSKSAGGPWYWVGSGIALFAGAYVSYKNGKNKGLIVADAIAQGVDIYRDQLDAVKGGSVAGDKLVSAIETVAVGTKVEEEVNNTILKATTPDKVIANKISFDDYIKG